MNLTRSFLQFAVIVSVLVGCADPSAIEQIKNDLAGIKQQQSMLIDKVNAIEAAVKSRPATPQPPPPGPFTISSKNAQVLGKPKAPVVIVAWSDFQCPYCAKLVPIVNDTLKDPEVSGKVAFVFKQYPLPSHQQSRPAARAALAAGRQGKFFEMHDKIFQNQGRINEENFLTWAKEIGLNIQTFKKDLADPSLDALIQEDVKEGDSAAVRGTPSVYIGTNEGGTYVVTRAAGRSVELFKKSIKELLQKKPV